MSNLNANLKYLKVLIVLVLLLLAIRAWGQSAQSYNCSSYNPNPAGQFCINTGSGSTWVYPGGDLAYQYGILCSPTNAQKCGAYTVKGLNGEAFNGTLANGQTWCFNSADGFLEPCAAGTVITDTSLTGQGSAASPLSSTGCINPVNVAFGADPTGATSSGQAIQAAWNTAYAAGVPLCFPAGTFVTGVNPLVFFSAKQSAAIIGAGGLSGATTISNINTADAPAVIVVPPDYTTSLGTIRASALVGSGNSLQFNSGKPYGLRINEIQYPGFGALGANILNGLSAMTVRFYFNPAAVSATAVILASSNVDSSVTGGVGITVNSSAHLVASVNIAGVQKTLTGTNTLSANTTYFAALVLCASGCADSGANLYLYDGVPTATGVAADAKMSVSGDVVQAVAESFVLGGIPSWPLFAVANEPFVGKIDSFDIENAADYTGASITIPNAKFTSTANTLYLNNFTSIAPTFYQGTAGEVDNAPVVSVDGLNGSAVSSDVWQLIWNPNYDGSGLGITVSHIKAESRTVPWFFAEEPNSLITDLSNGLDGGGSLADLVLFNNMYNTVVNGYQGTTSGPVGIECDWPPASMSNVAIVADLYGLVGVCGTQYHPIVTTASTILSAEYLSDFSPFVDNVLIDPEIDNENGGNGNGIEFASCASLDEIFGGQVIASGTGSAVLLHNADGGCGSNVSFHGTKFWGEYSVKFADTSPTTPPNVGMYSVQNQTGNAACTASVTPYACCTGNGTGTCPISNEVGWLTMGGCGGTIALSGGSGTFTNLCITSASVCSYVDLTTRANTATLGNPTDSGTVGITGGTGSDVLKLACP